MIQQQIFSEVESYPEFDKDLKKLTKRYRTLPEDLITFIKTQLNLFHKIKEDNKGIVRISDLGIENPPIYKARKFACRYLKGRGSNTGLRVIYAYIEEKDRIELIEIYFKGDKDLEDRERIKGYYLCE